MPDPSQAIHTETRRKAFLTSAQTAAAIAIGLLIPVGLLAKAYSGPAEHWVNDLLPGIFYVMFWCLAVFFFLRQTPPWIIAAGVVAVTSLLEFTQLSTAPLLEFIRGSWIGHALIGSTFDWWDFPHYVLGGFLAWLLMNAIRRYDDRRAHRGLNS